MEIAVSLCTVLYIHLHCSESQHGKEGTTKVSQQQHVYEDICTAGEFVISAQSRISRKSNPDAEAAARSESDG